jgi:uncharacterized membrane protein
LALSSAGLHYFPLPGPLLAVLAGALVLVLALIVLRALAFGYERMGIPAWAALLLLAASLLGSYVNIPLVRFPDAAVVALAETTDFGVTTVVPVVRDWPGMVLAVNLGGALIPAALSAYLVLRRRLLVRAFFCTAFVAAAVHLLARPVPGLGIAVPIYVAPLAAVLAALAASRSDAAPLAYIGGSLGALFGGDLLNLRHILELGAPIVSIGGAGVFDGIFVTGILALLLACLIGGRMQSAQPGARWRGQKRRSP